MGSIPHSPFPIPHFLSCSWLTFSKCSTDRANCWRSGRGRSGPGTRDRERTAGPRRWPGDFFRACQRATSAGGDEPVWPAVANLPGLGRPANRRNGRSNDAGARAARGRGLARQDPPDGTARLRPARSRAGCVSKSSSWAATSTWANCRPCAVGRSNSIARSRRASFFHVTPKRTPVRSNRFPW